MATTNPTSRLRAGVRILGLRVCVAILVKRTPVELALRLRFRSPLIVVRLVVTHRHGVRGAG